MMPLQIKACSLLEEVSRSKSCRNASTKNSHPLGTQVTVKCNLGILSGDGKSPYGSLLKQKYSYNWIVYCCQKVVGRNTPGCLSVG